MVSDASEHGRVELPRHPAASSRPSCVLRPASTSAHDRARHRPGPMTAPEDLERAILGAVRRADRRGGRRPPPGSPSSRPSGSGAPSASPRPTTRRRSAGRRRRARPGGRRSSEGRLDFDTIVRMTRAVGQTMDRLAEWEVATLAALLEDAATGEPPSATAALRLVEDDRAGLRGAAHLRLAAAPGRRGRPGGERSRARTRTSRWPRRRSGSPTWSASARSPTGSTTTRSATWSRSSRGRSHDVVSRRGGRVVKTLGRLRAVHGRRRRPTAWRSPGTSSQVIGGDKRLPDVRVGLVTGSGRAAHGRRLRARGQPGGPAGRGGPPQPGDHRRAHRRAAARPSGFETRVLPARPVRGFGDLEPVAVRRTQR